MAAATYVQKGEAIDYVPAADLAAGDVVVQGELVGIARTELKTGKTGSLAVAGVFDVAKATGGGTAINAGVLIYWDAGNGRATTDSASGSNKLLGKVVAAASDDDALVRVRMSQ